MSGNSVPKLKLFIQNIYEPENPEQYEAVQKQREQIITRLDGLRDDEKIEGFDVLDKAWDKTVAVAHRTNAGGQGKRAIERFDEFRSWANENGVSLEPHFTEIEINGADYARFPDVCLAAYEGVNVRGVFPCTDETTEYTIDDYLSALEAGEDWMSWKTTSSRLTPDHGVHGAIKAHIRENPQEVLGEEWVFSRDEYSVASGEVSEEYGRIDLVFKHEADETFLLVEVKPAKTAVDAAFGQALRYRYQFVRDRQLPELQPTDVQLAIAAPEFYESHRQAAEELDIWLVDV